MLQSQHMLTSHFPYPFSLSHAHNHFLSPSFSPPLTFIHTISTSSSRPITLCSPPTQPRPRPEPWLVQASEPTTTTAPTSQQEEEEGPIEFFQSTAPIFATSDEPSPIQVATSVLLTGAISIFLFRSLRRRAQRAKELVKVFFFFGNRKRVLVETFKWGSTREVFLSRFESSVYLHN